MGLAPGTSIGHYNVTAWSALHGDVPPRVRQAVQVCLQKDPKQRVRDISAIRLAMEGAFETTASTPTELAVGPALQVWQRPVAALGVVVLAVLLASLAGWSLTRPDPPAAEPVARFSVPLGADQGFSFVGRHLVALSLDGTQLVYGADDQHLSASPGSA